MKKKRGRPPKNQAARDHDLRVARGIPDPDHPEGWRTAEELAGVFGSFVCDAFNDFDAITGGGAVLRNVFRHQVGTYCMNTGEAGEARINPEPPVPEYVEKLLSRTEDQIEDEWKALSRKEITVDDLSAAALISLGYRTKAGNIINVYGAFAHEALQRYESHLNPAQFIIGVNDRGKKLSVKYSSAAESGALIAETIHAYIGGQLFRKLLFTYYEGLHDLPLTTDDIDQLSIALLGYEWAEALALMEHTYAMSNEGKAWHANLKKTRFLDMYVEDHKPGGLQYEYRYLHGLAMWNCYLHARKLSGCSRKAPHVRLCGNVDCAAPAFLHEHKVVANHRQGRPRYYCPVCDEKKESLRVARSRKRKLAKKNVTP